MTEPKKLTTAEILALARQKKAEAAAASSPPTTDSAESTPAASAPSETPAVESAPAAAEAPPAKPAAAPKTTADILAAARAAKAGGTPPAAATPPKSTADILAAARAGKGPATPAAGGAPKSTADILAAARAGKGAAAPVAKTAGDAPAANAPASAAPAAVSAENRPPLKDMVAVVKAADEGKPVAAVRPPVAAKPKLPQKDKVSRRSALQTLSAIAVSPFVIAWVAMSAIAGAWGLGMARFMMPNMVLELPSKFKVGPPSDFPPGTVSEKFKASRGVWIVHSTQYDGRDLIYALLSICTHLGCTPNWLEGEQKFKCPCHGSGFYITGINFEGPAPRPLERVGLRRAEDGVLEVDKSVKFQEELGQWSDVKSYFQNS